MRCYFGRQVNSLELSFRSPAMPNGFHPMSPTERLDEVARLLALGFLRLRARRAEQRRNDPNHLARFGLDFAAEGSVCDTDANAQRRRR